MRFDSTPGSLHQLNRIWAKDEAMPLNMFSLARLSISLSFSGTRWAHVVQIALSPLVTMPPEARSSMLLGWAYA